MTHWAKTSVLAWAAVTLSHLKLAIDPGETRPTGAGVTALTCIHTCSSVHTWLVMCAKIQIWFGRNKRKCQLMGHIFPNHILFFHVSVTDLLVLVLAMNWSALSSYSYYLWPWVRHSVSYCNCLGFSLTLVTEQSTPALFTVALPWLLTGAVFTGWIFSTLRTKFTLPSFSAPAIHKYNHTIWETQNKSKLNIHVIFPSNRSC